MSEVRDSDTRALRRRQCSMSIRSVSGGRAKRAVVATARLQIQTVSTRKVGRRVESRRALVGVRATPKRATPKRETPRSSRRLSSRIVPRRTIRLTGRRRRRRGERSCARQRGRCGQTAPRAPDAAAHFRAAAASGASGFRREPSLAARGLAAAQTPPVYARARAL